MQNNSAAQKDNKENKSNGRKSKSADIAMIALVTALTCTGGLIKIPLPPPLLPITLQTFFACLAGILLGAKRGALSQFIYVALGLLGVPVFSDGGGLMYVFKPSFGFLPGFVLCAYITGWLKERSASPLNFARVLLYSLCGLAGVYIIGLPYLAAVLKFYLSYSWAVSLTVTVNTLLYILGDLATLIILGVTAPVIIKNVPALR